MDNLPRAQAHEPGGNATPLERDGGSAGGFGSSLTKGGLFRVRAVFSRFCLTTGQTRLEIDLGPAKRDRDRTILFGLLGGFLKFGVVDSGHVGLSLEIDRGDAKGFSYFLKLHICVCADAPGREASFFF